MGQKAKLFFLNLAIDARTGEEEKNRRKKTYKILNRAYRMCWHTTKEIKQKQSLPNILAYQKNKTNTQQSLPNVLAIPPRK